MEVKLSGQAANISKATVLPHSPLLHLDKKDARLCNALNDEIFVVTLQSSW